MSGIYAIAALVIACLIVVLIAYLEGRRSGRVTAEKDQAEKTAEVKDDQLKVANNRPSVDDVRRGMRAGKF